MRIKSKFLELTRMTYPYGSERALERYLPKGSKMDFFGNYYLSIGESNTMFTCHLDTASFNRTTVNHVIENNIIKTDGTSILGADDKAGMVVLLYMIEKKISGLYYFFIGEERGCIGSSALSNSFLRKDSKYPQELLNINKVVSFDRRGTKSVITSQLYGDCCSPEFANELCNRLNNSKYGLEMEPDNTGILTDSAQFVDLIPECTNISVGYYREHGNDEHQDIDYLYKLCKACVTINWETLPISRNPDERHDYNKLFNRDTETIIDNSIDTLTFSVENYVWIKSGNEKIVKYVSDQWIKIEKEKIKTYIASSWDKFPYIIEDILWNGSYCYIKYQDSLEEEFIGNRTDLSKFIDDFMNIPSSHLCEYITDIEAYY